MRTIGILLLVVLLSTGCASVRFNPETGCINYTRIGDQQLEGFEITKTSDGYIVTLDKQQSEAEALSEAIKLIRMLSVPATL